MRSSWEVEGEQLLEVNKHSIEIVYRGKLGRRRKGSHKEGRGMVVLAMAFDLEIQQML